MLTELQMPTSKDILYNEIRLMAQSIADTMDRAARMSTFIANIEGTDLDTLAVPNTAPDDKVRTDMNNFRTMLSELVTAYESGGAQFTNVPKAVNDVCLSVQA